MFCEKCRKEISETEKFCPQCGNAVEAVKNEVTETVEETPAVTIAEMEEQAVKAAVATEERPEETAAEETAPQQEEITEDISLGIYKNEPETPKKSKKGIIIGASAAVVAAGAAAVGYFCFSNEVMHLFMGDAGFAGMVESNSMVYISGGELDTDEMDTVLADYAEQLFYGAAAEEEIQLSESMFDQLFSVYGDSAVTVTTKLDPGMILAMADEDGIFDIFNLEIGMEAVQGDDCSRISYGLIEEGQRTVGADLYIKDDKLVMLAPELTEQSFIIEPAQAEDDGESKERKEFSEKEMKRIREKLVEIYKNTLKETRIEFTKSGTDLVISETPIDSERVIVTFSAENLNAMLKEMGDFFRNDEYLRNYYVEATGNDISEYEKKFDEAEYDATAQLTTETYITDHAKVTGKKFIITATDSETSETFDVTFETTAGNCDFRAGNEEASFSFIQRKTDETSGVMEFILDGEELGAPLVLELSYTDAGIAEYCGQPVNTGTYVLRLSEKDEFFDYIIKGSNSEDDYDSDMMMVEETVPGSDMDLTSIIGMLKDIEIETSVKCDGNSVSSSFEMNIPLFFTIAFTADVKPLANAEKPVMPDYSDAIVMNDDFDAEDYPELSEEIMVNILALAEKSEFFGKIFAIGGYEF